MIDTCVSLNKLILISFPGWLNTDLNLINIISILQVCSWWAPLCIYFRSSKLEIKCAISFKEEATHTNRKLHCDITCYCIDFPSIPSFMEDKTIPMTCNQNLNYNPPSASTERLLISIFWEKARWCHNSHVPWPQQQQHLFLVKSLTHWLSTCCSTDESEMYFADIITVT